MLAGKGAVAPARWRATAAARRAAGDGEVGSITHGRVRGVCGSEVGMEETQRCRGGLGLWMIGGATGESGSARKHHSANKTTSIEVNEARR